MTPFMERALRRKLEIAYWRMVNMKDHLRQLDEEIVEVRARCAAWSVILRDYPDEESSK